VKTDEELAAWTMFALFSILVTVYALRSMWMMSHHIAPAWWML
jgi:hypothetical protein